MSGVNFFNRACCGRVAAAAACLLMLMAPLAAAEEEAAPAATDGGYDVAQVWFEEKDGGYAVNADLQAGAQALLKELLRGGYQAELKFELIFVQQRDWWFDREIGDIEWRAALSYDSVLQRYLLSAGGAQQRFTTFERMMTKVQQLRAGASRGAEYMKIFQREDVYLRARFYLNTKKLPKLVQIELLLNDFLNFNSSGWSSLPLRVRP